MNKIPADIKSHLMWGAIMALFIFAVALLPRHIGFGATIIFASVAAAFGVEKYQEIRNEGVPSFYDLVASAAPGLVLGFVVGVLELFL